MNHKVKSLSDCMEIQLELPLDLSVGTADRIIVEGIQTQDRKPTKTFFSNRKIFTIARRAGLVGSNRRSIIGFPSIARNPDRSILPRENYPRNLFPSKSESRTFFNPLSNKVGFPNMNRSSG